MFSHEWEVDIDVSSPSQLDYRLIRMVSEGEEFLFRNFVSVEFIYVSQDMW